MMLTPPVWTTEQLDEARKHAEDYFRQDRYKEPVEVYHDLFDKYQGIVEEFFEQTIDLSALDENALALLTDKDQREVFRYLSGPPISEDDLRVLMDARSIAPKALKADPELLQRLTDFIRDWRDRRRFPWLGQDWEPTEQNRDAAVLATTALLTMRRVETMRRGQGKSLQEALAGC